MNRASTRVGCHAYRFRPRPRLDSVAFTHAPSIARLRPFIARVCTHALTGPPTHPYSAPKKDWCKITTGPHKDKYVGSSIGKTGTPDGNQLLISPVDGPIQRQTEAQLSAEDDGRQDSGVIETASGTKYVLSGPPTPCLVGVEGDVPPTKNGQGGRSGYVYGKEPDLPDGTETGSSRVTRTERGGQIIETESGSRYRLFPAPTNSTI